MRRTAHFWRGPAHARRHELGDPARGIVLLLAIFAPVLWSAQAIGDRRRQPAAGPVGQALARHEHSRPGHLLPGPRRHPAVGRARPRRDRDRRRLRPRARHGTADRRPPRGPGHHLGHQRRGGVPRAAARAVLRGDLRYRRRGRAARDRVRLAPAFARLVRTLSASVAGLDYIAAARIAGVSRLRLLTRHVLPNIGEPLIVNATIAAGDALLSFAGLSFLGLGVQAPSYDWGQLLNDGLQGIYTRPAAALAPGVAVVIAGLAFNLFGEALAVGLGVSSPRIGRLRSALAAAAGKSTAADQRASSRTEAADSVLRISELRSVVPRRGSSCPRRQLHPGARRGGRRGRRVRLRQVPDRPGGLPAPRGPRERVRRPASNCSARIYSGASRAEPPGSCRGGRCGGSSASRPGWSSRTR